MIFLYIQAYQPILDAPNSLLIGVELLNSQYIVWTLPFLSNTAMSDQRAHKVRKESDSGDLLRNRGYRLHQHSPESAPTFFTAQQRISASSTLAMLAL
ncbi:unnamed protein product [Cuscuta europaea]|uniref:Uncharacterized protein n=1 Tax=Cuscuta europaea TaxID=41803 RepID=A0A9P0YTB9_CUSEU|nr:unnamed protein product [Cuscuta europaea]